MAYACLLIMARSFLNSFAFLILSSAPISTAGTADTRGTRSINQPRKYSVVPRTASAPFAPSAQDRCKGWSSTSISCLLCCCAVPHDSQKLLGNARVGLCKPAVASSVPFSRGSPRRFFPLSVCFGGTGWQTIISLLGRRMLRSRDRHDNRSASCFPRSKLPVLLLRMANLITKASLEAALRGSASIRSDRDTRHARAFGIAKRSVGFCDPFGSPATHTMTLSLGGSTSIKRDESQIPMEAEERKKFFSRRP